MHTNLSFLLLRDWTTLQRAWAPNITKQRENAGVEENPVFFVYGFLREAKREPGWD